MLGWLHKTLLLLLVVLLIPGAFEVMENLWHLGATGHVAHAADAGADHAPQGQEHGCSGTFHFCTCCPTLTFRVPMAATLGAEPEPLRRAHRFHLPLYESPPLPLPDRPPRV